MIQFSPLFSIMAKQLDQLLVLKNIKLILYFEIQEALLKIEEDSLIRVLVNLIDITIKFSYHNSEINVRVYLDGTTICLDVTDTGIGFD